MRYLIFFLVLAGCSYKQEGPSETKRQLDICKIDLAVCRAEFEK